jgi:hypothetical protein
MSPDDELMSPRTAETASLMLTSWFTPEWSPSETPQLRWHESIKKLDEALTSGDPGSMLRAWQAASVAALVDRGWQSMVMVGDAAIRIGRATGLNIAFSAKARQAYHVALFRSHRASDIDGVLQTAEGFTELRATEIVEQCLRIAARLYEAHPTLGVRGKMDALRARLTNAG